MRTHSGPSQATPHDSTGYGAPTVASGAGHRRYIAAVVAIATVVTVGVAVGPAAAGSPSTSEAVGEAAAADAATPPDRPHALDAAIGDLVVRLSGNVCSGTPITGTVYVVTAAHCVLTESGEVTQRTVVRNHMRYPAVAVLVDTDYHDHRSEQLDAAVLVMAQVIPGPSVRVGSTFPGLGQVTLVGFQPVDGRGTLLRGSRPDGPPRPNRATGSQTARPYRPAGCVEPVDALDVSAARVMVPCGLVPGASGGGLYAEEGGELVLVGILSTVTSDESANGVVPLDSLQELLAHPDRYAHGFHGHANQEHVRSDRP